MLWIKSIVKNIHNLVDTEIKGKLKTNNTTDKQIKKYKKHGSELINGEKFVCAHEGIIIPVIIHCRTPESCNFKRSLGFKLNHMIICKEKTVSESIKDAFKRKSMQTEYSFLVYKIEVSNRSWWIRS